MEQRVGPEAGLANRELPAELPPWGIGVFCGYRHLVMRTCFLALVSILPIIELLGCSVLPLGTRANEGPAASRSVTRATTQIARHELGNDVFVGVALSGGGSRAANFSAAVLLELAELGFLRTVSAISSVSGSSLTAAYYGLFGSDPGRMKDVFDDILFEGKTFREMPHAGPKILINATSLPEEGKFVFTDEAFAELNSRLDTYPVSHAVMASGAFPGAFHNVTLEDYKSGGYVHVFDGGAADNLGSRLCLKWSGSFTIPRPVRVPAGASSSLWMHIRSSVGRAGMSGTLVSSWISLWTIISRTPQTFSSRCAGRTSFARPVSVNQAGWVSRHCGSSGCSQGKSVAPVAPPGI